MTNQPSGSASQWLSPLGDFRWVRTHVSAYAVGVVLLVIANLLIGGSRLWSLTAVGIWSMLLIVHLVLLAIARLSAELLTDDDEEIVLLPVKDAVIVETDVDPTATWSTPEPESAPEDDNGETVSWQIATDAAQNRRIGPEKMEDEPS